jgi:hypothetical protein
VGRNGESIEQNVREMKGEVTMELLDRYVYDVGRRLPAKQREDIEKELKSLLMDALDARTGGRTPTNEDISAVITQFGQPADVAARYTGEKFLIGPRLYPTYRLVIGIVLAAMAFGLLVSFFIGFTFGPMTGSDLWSRLLQFFGSLISSVWGAIGVVTVIFWGIERGIIKHNDKMGGEDKWDPKTLPPVPKSKNAWKPSESIVAIVFIIIALILFNAFPEVVSFYTNDGQWQHIQILSPAALAAYLPLWNIGWILALVLHCVLLAQGRWRTGTNLGHIALQLYSIVVVGIMMTGPALLNPDITLLGGTQISTVFHQVMPMLNMQFRWVFVIVIIVCAVDIGKSIYRMIKEKA